MKRNLLFTALIMATILMFSCGKKVQQSNPLLADWDTPFGSIPFDKIKNTDYEPAFKEAIKQHDQEIKQIVENKDKATFANTVEALDRSGRLLAKVYGVFDNITASNTNDELDAIKEKISPMVSSHEDDIMMNEGLFNRIKTVWDNRSKENLNPEQLHLLKQKYESFIRRGALLSKEKKVELRKVNDSLTKLIDKYNRNVLSQTKSYKLVISDKKDLQGLPEWLIESAAQNALDAGEKGKWVFTLDNASCLPFLTYCENRKLRQDIFNARINRANNSDAYDNNKICEEILTLRAKFASLLGYKTFADWQLEERMAKTPEKAEKLLADCLPYAVKAAQKDIAEFQRLLDKDQKGAKLEGWDMYYYAEKLKKIRYEFDEEQTRPYFEIENVKRGCFENIGRLYGLSFTKLDNVKAYASDVDVYEVKNKAGEHVGLLYFDPYTRNGKSSGAWCNAFKAQYKEVKDGKLCRVDPIISVCFNFAKQKGRTTLTADEVCTVFHEMGHATNEFLSDGTYPSTSGTMVPTDFVECASQLSEHWAMMTQVLKTYAKDAQGKLIPQSLVDKVQRAGTFNQGFMFTELLAAAYLDLKMHLLTETDTINLQEFENSTMKKISVPQQIPPRYRSTYFTHVFGGGYSAGYYCYTWSEMLDGDAFQAWKETRDIFNPKISQKFQKYILSEGGKDEADLQYRRFRGKDPDPKYMLQNRGLL